MCQANVVQKIKTHILCCDFVYEIVAFVRSSGKNTVDVGKPQMTIWCMRITCWIPKATNTYTHKTCKTYYVSITTMSA